MLYTDFFSRYCVLSNDPQTAQGKTDPKVEDKQNVAKLLEDLEIERKVYKLGCSQVRSSVMLNLMFVKSNISSRSFSNSEANASELPKIWKNCFLNQCINDVYISFSHNIVCYPS